MPLVSAYSSLLQSGRVEEQEKRKMNPQTKEPLFTNFNPRFSGTLDYVFYTGVQCGFGSLALGFRCPMPNSPTSSDALYILLIDYMLLKPPFDIFIGGIKRKYRLGSLETCPTYAKVIEKFGENEVFRQMFMEMPESRRKDWVLNFK